VSRRRGVAAAARQLTAIEDERGQCEEYYLSDDGADPYGMFGLQKLGFT
jgi:hypothetical protein